MLKFNILYAFGLISIVNALDNGLFLTPPMGWLSWARFRCNTKCETHPSNCINEDLYRDMADIMVRDGWLKAGYNFVNIDDCWSKKERHPISQELVEDETRFPNGMKNLGDYIHSKGLKFGIYGDCGEYTCAKYPGSINHYKLDAETFARWGVDSLKFDGCYANTSMMSTYYPEMAKALNHTGRSIGFICSWPAYIIGKANFLEIRKYCNSWRNYNDIGDSYGSVDSIIDWFANNQDQLVKAAGPGGWNDPDMLVIGNFGLTYGQSRIQMAIWSILAAPLMLGNDLRDISNEAKSILLNKEIIGVNQDPMGKSGLRIFKNSIYEIWTRPLQSGNLAVVIARRKNNAPYYPTKLKLVFQNIGWKKGSKAYVRDLFKHQNLGQHEKEFEFQIRPQDAMMFLISQHQIMNIEEEFPPTDSDPWTGLYIFCGCIFGFLIIGFLQRMYNRYGYVHL